MKILLDECVDWRLSREISPHEVVAVHRHGWAGLKNGELLKRAEQEFAASQLDVVLAHPGRHQ